MHLLLLLLACAPQKLDDSSPARPDADADTDSDADADTDTDSDADTDSDTDTDSDADTDSDTDADPADDGWPAVFAAPYVDATGYPTVKVGEIPAENGVHYYTLAFIVASSSTACDASWGSYYTIEAGPSAWDSGAEYTLYEQIDALRAVGGDVMVSFGGAAGTPIEASCHSVDDVVAQYQRVIDQLALTRIDFDIEGSWVADDASILRRSQAIATLQANAAAAGQPLHVWYTLPVLPTGLTADGVAVLQSAVDNGVDLDGVNVMTMDYGDGSAPSPEGQMGSYGIDAIEALHDQLATLWPTMSDDELWAHVGTTPMIGQNDVQSEFFEIADAEQTRAYAEDHGVGMLGYWSINRDHPCETESPWASSTCNGTTTISDWEYAAVFAGYGE